MPKPISKEKRADIIKHMQADDSPKNKKNIAKWLFVCTRTVTRVWELFSRTGSYEANLSSRGRKPLVSEAEMSLIEARIEQQPDITLLKLIEEFNLPISESALSKRLKKSGFRLKKIYPHEQDRADVAEKRCEWNKWQDGLSALDLKRLRFLDESSINLAYTLLYGRAKAGVRKYEGVKDVRFKRQSILSTISFDGTQVPIVFEGTLNKELFAEYLEKMYFPTVVDDDILILDNSSVHTHQDLFETP
jgi:transposase